MCAVPIKNSWMNEFLCYENGGKITKASRAKIWSSPQWPMPLTKWFDKQAKCACLFYKSLFPSEKSGPSEIKKSNSPTDFLYNICFRCCRCLGTFATSSSLIIQVFFWHNRFPRIYKHAKTWFLWPAVTVISAYFVFHSSFPYFIPLSGFLASLRSFKPCRLLKSRLKTESGYFSFLQRNFTTVTYILQCRVSENRLVYLPLEVHIAKAP